MKTTRDDSTEFCDILQMVQEEGASCFVKIMEKLMNRSMVQERENFIGAKEYERTEERNGYANGFKDRKLVIPEGTLHLQIPQVRNREDGEKFYPQSLEYGRRCDRSLMMAIAEMYIQGVSTRKVNAIFKAMCGPNISAEMVSKSTSELDREFTVWRNRPIGEIRVIYVDATYLKVRCDGRVISMPAMVAIGVTGDGRRSVLAVRMSTCESEAEWREFLLALKERGIYGVKLCISDSNPGLKKAFTTVFPGAEWQRCLTHLQRNAQAYVTKAEYKEKVASDIRSIMAMPTREEAERMLKNVVEKYEKCQSKLAAWLEENVPECFTVFNYPEEVRIKIRTNNIMERLNKAIKKRTNIVTVFPNESSAIRLVTALCLEISDEWEAGKSYLNVSVM